MCEESEHIKRGVGGLNRHRAILIDHLLQFEPLPSLPVPPTPTPTPTPSLSSNNNSGITGITNVIAPQSQTTPQVASTTSSTSDTIAMTPTPTLIPIPSASESGNGNIDGDTSVAMLPASIVTPPSLSIITSDIPDNRLVPCTSGMYMCNVRTIDCKVI
jgi:hypothetical protein